MLSLLKFFLVWNRKESKFGAHTKCYFGDPDAVYGESCPGNTASIDLRTFSLCKVNNFAQLENCCVFKEFTSY